MDPSVSLAGWARFPPRAGTKDAAFDRTSYLSRRGASQPPLSFRRRSCHGPSGPRRKCGVRRREPVYQEAGVYFNQKGPRCAVCSGEQKRTGRWSGPRENAPGGPRMSAPPEDEMAPWTPTRLGEGASHALGGVPGRILASGRQKSFWAPAIFLWYRQAAPSLSKKEMVGPTVPRLEGGFPRPAARSRILPSQPAAGTAPTKQVVLGIQSLRPLRGQLPVHKGALQGAAAP